MRAVVGGRAVVLEAAAAARALADVRPEAIRDLFVVIGGVRYPVKQALEVVARLDRSEFTSHQARSILRRLGFSVGRATAGVARETAEPYRATEHVGPTSWAAMTDDGEILFEDEDPHKVVAEIKARKLDAAVFGIGGADWDASVVIE